MLALLGYPFLLEPWVATRVQALGLVGSAMRCSSLLCIAAADRRLRAPAQPAANAAPGAATESRRAARRPLARQLLWCALAATGSLLLLAVSNHITQNIAAVPLLWIVPLAIYLLTFILCFDSSRLVPPGAVPVDGRGGARRDGVDARRPASHARSRDPARRVLRRAVHRVHVLPRRARAQQARAALPDALLPDDLARRRARRGARRHRRAARCCTRTSSSRSASSPARCCCCGRSAATAPCSRRSPSRRDRDDRLRGLGPCRSSTTRRSLSTRNFYGVLRVQESGSDDSRHRRSLIHGTILHGNQYLGPAFRRQPSTYYTTTSGIGRAAGIDASEHDAAQGRRHRPRHRHARDLRQPRATSTGSTTSIRR